MTGQHGPFGAVQCPQPGMRLILCIRFIQHSINDRIITPLDCTCSRKWLHRSCIQATSNGIRRHASPHNRKVSCSALCLLTSLLNPTTSAIVARYSYGFPLGYFLSNKQRQSRQTRLGARGISEHVRFHVRRVEGLGNPAGPTATSELVQRRPKSRSRNLLIPLARERG